MRVVRPSPEHPIYIEWKKWQEKTDSSVGTPEYFNALEAKKSIERIAEHMYPEGSIVGFMLMRKDTEDMEKNSSTQSSNPE